MALQRELLKSVAVALLVLLHASGVPVLPAASMTAIAVVQGFTLVNTCLQLPSKVPAKVDSIDQRASARVSITAAWCAAGLVLAVLFARFLRVLDLCSSSLQVAFLACLGGALCCCMVSFARHSGSVCECSQRSSHAGVRCPYDPGFWAHLEEKEATEHESLLEGLVEECFGPRSMLAGSFLLDTES